MFKNQFPKKCKCCGITYSKEEYLQLSLASNGVMFQIPEIIEDPELDIVNEVRNCPCGGTMYVEVPPQEFNAAARRAMSAGKEEQAGDLARLYLQLNKGEGQ
jgi:hypothetical protein